MDSGTTDHFLRITSSHKNVRESKYPIKITIPYGNNMHSNKECDIYWPMLPPGACIGRLVPTLKQQALISVVKLCNAGCKVIFQHDCCIVMYREKSYFMEYDVQEQDCGWYRLQQHKRKKESGNKKSRWNSKLTIYITFLHNNTSLSIYTNASSHQQNQPLSR